MDVVLEVFDTFALDAVWATLLPALETAAILNATSSTVPQTDICQFVPASAYLSFTPGKYACLSQWPRDDWRRQLVELFFISWLFGLVVYFTFATVSYLFVFDKAICNHPKYHKNQIATEIGQACKAFPGMAVLMAPLFLLEVRGYSKLYDTSADGPGLWYNVLQFPFFICFTDYFIYWIHRCLHHPSVYKHIHKSHHKFIVPTPYASHAFNPLDGFAQGLPYHLFLFIFPLQKFAFVLLFVFVNFWTILIHDGEYISENPIVNGAACHTIHHLYFNFNYGQFTTLWDRLGGTYRLPNDELFRKELKMCQS